ncbi:TetR/AcrR family transcriptional regulator [Streptomyces sp. DSM 44915]|uniref:TetR/AcrR family transcriptional regulator n=1 Tax=Streptomyces chisholmiae TaxID=3075540 RepID=A0ABU2JN71_9ACTN|nr:TetR/AcrR family transcriptional regulator [Streptomyces sp. DSM 44915]MDT0265688.1 TetR/AcrR family transcriptional regulator [Streptomyces sp. DSM 44915]
MPEDPADHPTPAPPARPTLRERRRAAATREILEAAERHLTERGPAALSLRAVARDLGMTVQALYHYFPHRDALVTALITKTYEDLADALQAATADPARDPELPGLVVVAEAYRGWAVANPERFQLIYGTPLRDYAAPVDGPTTAAVRRMGAIFQREVFHGYPRERLAAVAGPAPSPAFQAALTSPDGLPPAAGVLFLSAWGHLHGLVVLEVFGHTGFLGEHQAELFRLSTRAYHADLHRRITGTDGPSGG